jgi:hypothetical protein
VPRRARALLALAVVLAGCGSATKSRPDDYRRAAALACPGASTGSRTLAGAPSPQRVKREGQVALRAAQALARARPPDDLVVRHREAVRMLQSQAARLSLVLEQMDRGPAPRVVLDAARAGLRAGDRQATASLAAVGVTSC